MVVVKLVEAPCILKGKNVDLGIANLIFSVKKVFNLYLYTDNILLKRPLKKLFTSLCPHTHF